MLSARDSVTVPVRHLAEIRVFKIDSRLIELFSENCRSDWNATGELLHIGGATAGAPSACVPTENAEFAPMCETFRFHYGLEIARTCG